MYSNPAHYWGPETWPYEATLKTKTNLTESYIPFPIPSLPCKTYNMLLTCIFLCLILLESKMDMLFLRYRPFETRAFKRMYLDNAELWSHFTLNILFKLDLNTRIWVFLSMRVMLSGTGKIGVHSVSWNALPSDLLFRTVCPSIPK